MNKTLIVFLSGILFCIFHLGLSAQEIVPGEYIVQWKSETAALTFYKNHFTQKSAIQSSHKFILADKKVWDHVIVQPDQAPFYEHLFKNDPCC
jgi:hypothetical protein